MTLVNGRQNRQSVVHIYSYTIQQLRQYSTGWGTFPFLWHSERLNMNLPGRQIGRHRPVSWPPRSPDLKPLEFFSLGLCERPSVQPKSEYAGRTGWMDHCSNCKCHRASGMRCTVRGMYAELRITPILKCSACNKFYSCVQRNYFELTITSEVSAFTYTFYSKVTCVKDPGILLQDIEHLSCRYSKF
jgi:hypothetical protein